MSPILSALIALATLASHGFTATLPESNILQAGSAGGLGGGSLTAQFSASYHIPGTSMSVAMFSPLEDRIPKTDALTCLAAAEIDLTAKIAKNGNTPLPPQGWTFTANNSVLSALSLQLPSKPAVKLSHLASALKGLYILLSRPRMEGSELYKWNLVNRTETGDQEILMTGGIAAETKMPGLKVPVPTATASSAAGGVVGGGSVSAVPTASVGL